MAANEFPKITVTSLIGTVPVITMGTEPASIEYICFLNVVNRSLRLRKYSLQLIVDAQHGQLGLGLEYEHSQHRLPKICSYRMAIVRIACGAQHSSFVTEQGHIYVMGSNEFGQLGLGNVGRVS
jgi:hypothetical protein